jgi:ion channel-forming bestrophin family protein
MHAGHHYTLREILNWTRREIFVFIGVSVLPVTASWLGWDIPFVPWAPIAVLGVAVAFVTGFKSNAAYDRMWEARKIWGGIVNTSRSWAVLVRDFIAIPEGDSTHQRMVYRHFAWLTALRFQLREHRAWETTHFAHNREYRKETFEVPERQTRLEEELLPYLSAEEHSYVLGKKNRATVLLALQSADLLKSVQQGQITEFRHIELTKLITSLYELQGKCERIKNFPYPRQFASLNLIFVWLFILILPFGLMKEFEHLGSSWIWLTIPTTVVIAWVFHTMDKIGEASENPFEGSSNDIPITTMSRAIEIDLRDLADENDLPAAHPPHGHIVM